MFKKKPTIKPLSPLRSSERRKLADSIISTYSLSPPLGNSEEQSEEERTSSHAQLRNSLLPDGTQSARFMTTLGANAKKIDGTLYVGSLPGEEGRVLWFRVGHGPLLPSVYTLWQTPKIVPLLHTPDLVVEKIRGGADLMTPGLYGPPFPTKATKDAVVAIASLDAPSVPIALGRAVIDIASLKTARGAKGAAVETLHWAGDEIWVFNQSDRPGTAVPASVDGWGIEAERAIGGKLENLDLADEDEQGGVRLETAGPASRQEDNVYEDTSDAVQDYVEEKTSSATAYSVKDLDDIFHKAFLYGVYQQIKAHPDQPNHGLDFPLTQSFVMSALIQPFLPIFSAEDSKQLQIKNTSYKGLKKFIKHLDTSQLVKSKVKPSESVIIDIDFKDNAISSFQPYRLPKKDSGTTTNQSQGPATDAGDTSIGQTLSLATVYKVPERFSSLLESADTPVKPGTFLSSSEVKSAVSTYVGVHNLSVATNKRLVTLDPFLANSVFTGTMPLDKDVLAKGSVPREALIERIITQCTPHHLINRNSSPIDESSSRPRPGPAPKVKITLETRSGNKTVTKISGLERFYINPSLLADELRKTCAGSTSVEPLMGASPKEKLVEVMVQGPQRDAVIKALERRGVKAAWAEVLDKVKKKK